MPSLCECRAALFDLDGTLLDTYGLILASFRHATLKVLGEVIPDEVLMARVGVPLAVQMGDFTDDESVRIELVAAFREFNEAAHDGAVRTFDGVAEVLEGCAARGIPAAVVTSKRRALAQRGLGIFGFDRLVEFVIGSDDLPQHKPDPAPLLLACERLGVAPRDAVYVGDSPFDLQAAHAAGCRSVAAGWGMFAADVLKKESPDAFASAPGDLQDLLFG